MSGAVPEFTPVAFQDWKEEEFQECWAMGVADVDQDGTPEILLTGWTGNWSTPGVSGELRVVRFQPPDRLVQVGRITWPGHGAAFGHAVCAADVDMDAKVEVVVVGGTYRPDATDPGIQAHLRVMTFDGVAFQIDDEMTWHPDVSAIKRHLDAPATVVGSALDAVTVADIDGDGRPEIVCAGSVVIEIDDPALRQDYYNLAWIEVFDWTRSAASRRTPKLRHVFWPGMDNWAGIPVSDIRLTDVGCADIYGDGQIEIVTVGYNDVSAELCAWGVRQGDQGLELRLIDEASWPYRGSTHGHNPLLLHLRIDELLGERGALEIVTGGGQYVQRRTLAEPNPTHSDRVAADMGIWRPLPHWMYREMHQVHSFTVSGLDFQRSGCEGVFSADIDGDGQTEVVSVHEARPPVGGSPMYGHVIAWDPTRARYLAHWDDSWKRALSYGIENAAGDTLETKSAGVWSGDIDGDGRVETVLSGYYADRGERGVWVGMVR